MCVRVCMSVCAFAWQRCDEEKEGEGMKEAGGVDLCGCVCVCVCVFCVCVCE